MGGPPLPKQFLPIDGIPILGHTLKKFELCELVNQIILVARCEDRSRCEQLIQENEIKKVTTIVEGGKERQDSVFCGLQHAHVQTEIVLIHDAVRMFVSEDILIQSIDDARRYGASVTAVPVKDTIKQVEQRALPDTSVRDPDLDDEIDVPPFFVSKTLDRHMLWQIQTPQTFRYPLIVSVHQKAQNLGISATDDAMLVEYFGYPVKIVQGSYRNIKITTSDDLLIAQAFLRSEK